MSLEVLLPLLFLLGSSSRVTKFSLRVEIWVQCLQKAESGDGNNIRRNVTSPSLETAAASTGTNYCNLETRENSRSHFEVNSEQS